MSKVLIVLAYFTYISASVSADGNILCYYNSSAALRPGNGKFTASDIQPSFCTHIIYSSIGLSPNGSVERPDNFDTNDIETLKEFKKQNSSLQIMVHMYEDFATYSKVVSDATTRQNFVNSVIEFLDEYGFDGFDMDWKFPSSNKAVAGNFTTLLQELKIALGKRDKIFVLDVSGNVQGSKLSYDVAGISENVDMLNIMAMEYHGPFENFTGHYAPLYPSHLDETDDQKLLNVAAGVQYWLDEGVDPTKIILGIGSYGRGFTLAVPNNTSLYATAIGGSKAGPYSNEKGFIGFNEICEFYSDWEQTWDGEQGVPHLVNGDQWIGFHERTAIELKVKQYHMMGLSGVSLWSLDTDDFGGICGGGIYPLLYTIYLYI